MSSCVALVVPDMPRNVTVMRTTSTTTVHLSISAPTPQSVVDINTGLPAVVNTRHLAVVSWLVTVNSDEGHTDISKTFIDGNYYTLNNLTPLAVVGFLFNPMCSPSVAVMNSHNT